MDVATVLLLWYVGWFTTTLLSILFLSLVRHEHLDAGAVGILMFASIPWPISGPVMFFISCGTWLSNRTLALEAAKQRADKSMELKS